MLSEVGCQYEKHLAHSASRTFSVPRSTLDDYDVGEYRGGKVGRPTIFTEDEEMILAKLLIRFTQIGCPYNENHLRPLILQLTARKGMLS